MKSLGTPNKLKSSRYGNGHGHKATTMALSVDRPRNTINDRDRRRQIIAKLAEKRKQYQTGIGKAERESFKQRIKTSIIKHKQQTKLQKNPKIITIKHNQNNRHLPDKKEEEEEEHKSISISTSISPIQVQPKHHIQNVPKSTSNSPSLLTKNRKIVLDCNASMHDDIEDSDTTHDDIEDNDSMYIDVRDEELRMLRAQNQRLANKLEHVNTELIETNVFLRSERKRNKNLFNELKSKETEIMDLSQNIDELESEIEEKDKKCVEIVERLSEYEQKNKRLSQVQEINKNLSSNIKENYNEIKEWQNKYYDIFEKYSTSKSQHKQQTNNLKNELNQRSISETENMNTLKRLIDTQNDEMITISKENETLIDNIHSITKLMQNQIKSNNNNVSKELNSMSVDSKSEIDTLLQSLIGVFDKCDQLNQHNNELSSYLTNYENDIEASKNIINELEGQCTNQQQRWQTLQDKYTTLTNDKLQMDHKSNETTKELQKLYATIFDATQQLQQIAVRVTNKQDIGDIDMNQCIEIIADSVKNNQIKAKEVNNLLAKVMTQHLKQMDSVEQIFISVTRNWSQRIHGLQDNLSNVQLGLLRNSATNNSNLSALSLTSNKSFRVDDIQSQCNHQIGLINQLKNEINEKHATIKSLLSTTNNIQQSNHNQTIKTLQSALDTTRKERDDALNDFHKIADEWNNMEQHVDVTYNENATLQKQLNDVEYWTDYMVGYMEQRINGTCAQSSKYQIQFESIANDIPTVLNQLHSSLLYILTRMDLNALNDTKLDDINDDVLLEQLFGNVEDNNNEKEKELHAAQDMIHRLEAEICLESIVNKVELSQVGSKTERIITAYKDKLLTYREFIERLQAKMTHTSKLMHSMKLERDHSWSQYQIVNVEVNKLNEENAVLRSSLASNAEKLNDTTQQLRKLMEQYGVKMDAMSKQIELSEDRNANMHNRLNESALIIEEISHQRNEFEGKCINMSDKFVQYKNSSDMLFKHSCRTMIESLDPLIIKLNEYSFLSERMENMTEKVKCLQAHYIKMKKEEDKSEKTAVSKARMHADIHRFQFAKALQEMKQKYVVNIEQLKQRITSLQSKCMKKKSAYNKLNENYVELKKLFNKESANFEHVRNENKKKENALTEVINNLNQQLDGNKEVINNLNVELGKHKKYLISMQNQSETNMKQREEIHAKLSEQTKKSRKWYGKAVKFSSELKDLKIKYKEIERKNLDFQSDFNELNAMNMSLKEAINTKDINHKKSNAMDCVQINELKDALQNVQSVNNNLNNKTETQQQEISKMCELNKECIDNLEHVKREKLFDEQRYFDKEEDLRNEINIIRQQLHETTNDLGILKLSNLEKDTVIKKLQNEINGLREEISFYKQCQEKDQTETDILNKQISRKDQSHQQKMNDIKMILDAKTVRIMQLQQDVDCKIDTIKGLESENIELKNESLSNKSLMNKERELLKNKNNENNKFQRIIKDISSELNQMKQELEKQKNANVELSIELDSVQQNKNLVNYGHNYSSVSFFDIDLEKNTTNTCTSSSMPEMNNQSNNNYNQYSDEDEADEILQKLNLGKTHNYSDNLIKSNSANYANIHSAKNTKNKKKPGLPIPKRTVISKVSLFGHNAEGNQTD